MAPAPCDPMAAAKKPTPKSPAPKPKGSKRLTVELPDVMHRKLKSKAAEEGVSMKDLVLAILREKGFG